MNLGRREAGHMKLLEGFEQRKAMILAYAF